MNNWPLNLALQWMGGDKTEAVPPNTYGSPFHLEHKKQKKTFLHKMFLDSTILKMRKKGTSLLDIP